MNLNLLRRRDRIFAAATGRDKGNVPLLRIPSILPNPCHRAHSHILVEETVEEGGIVSAVIRSDAEEALYFIFQ